MVLLLCGLAACGSDQQCSARSVPYCDGQTAWFCNGGGDKGPLKWESHACSADQQCIRGQCLSEPLVSCPEEKRGREGCSPDGLHLGWCTDAGYWSWMFVCDPKLNSVCEERVVNDSGHDEMRVSCVLTSHETCAEQDSRACRGDVRLECTGNGLWGWPRDCAAEGMVCREGECTGTH